jgi:isopropylmalate/homocitrate/citramalate synthase
VTPSPPPGMPDRVVLQDVTLREGEQGSDRALDPKTRMALARHLVDAGLTHLEAGWPGVSKQDQEFVRQLRDALPTVHVQAPVALYAANWEEQIAAAHACGVQTVALLHPASDLRLRTLERLSRQEVLQRVHVGVQAALAVGLSVTLVATDATRADPGFLVEVALAAQEAGAHRIGLPDTVGCATPEAYGALVSQVRRQVGLPIHAHCHNDFGLALANTLAGIRAGASLADVSVNGLGERAGNCSLAEAAVALEVLYGVRTGVRLEALAAVAREVARAFGTHLPGQAPLVGDLAFAHRLDVHVYGATFWPQLFEPLDPASVGNRRRLLLGRHSGARAVSARLQALGIDPDGVPVRALADAVRQLATLLGGGISDEILLVLARTMQSQAVTSTEGVISHENR